MATSQESSLVIGGTVTITESHGDGRQMQDEPPKDSVRSESIPLLVDNPRLFGRKKSKFRRLTFLKSKSAILILIWSFLAQGVLQWTFTDPSSFTTPLVHGPGKFFTAIIIGSVYVYFAILQLFYPLAGYLADVRYGRYKCVIGSLWCFVISSVTLGCLGGFLTFVYITGDESHAPWLFYINMTIFYATIVFLVPSVLIGIFLFFSSIVAFNANVIQFGLDQLHDSPSEHLVLYIHWFVVLSYAGTEMIKASVSPLTSYCIFAVANDIVFPIIILSIVCFLLLFAYFCLLISLCVATRKCRAWFLEDTGSKNPYGLVYRVISFAREHKNPIQRSAFTYCEDELPSRLDLAKEKYGGPFTTEQVEDVKVFLGIFKVLLALGPFFAVEGSNSILLQTFYTHISRHYTSYSCSLSNDLLPFVIIVFLLILYIVLLRPFVHKYIPGIFKRVGMGMVLMLIPTLCFFILDTVYHKVSQNSNVCFLLEYDPYFPPQNLSNVTPSFSETKLGEYDTSIVTNLLVIPLFCSISGSMIFYIAVYEFIYSQSPHSMKGLMFGTFFAIRGVFQLLGALIFIFPFLGWKSKTSFPSCGFVYFLVSLIIALFGLMVYIWVAKKYRYRERDEPDNIYRYAEDYYANTQDDPNYDYDDYDNLNVHTIN